MSDSPPQPSAEDRSPLRLFFATRRGKIIGAALAGSAAVLLGVAVAIGLGGNGDQGSAAASALPSASASAPATISPTPAPLSTPIETVSSAPPPAPAPTSVAGGWHRAPDQPAFDGSQLRLVIWTSSRFIAAGHGPDGEAFFDSPDGITWHRQPSVDSAAFPRGLAAGARGVVAVGDAGTTAASWFSADGLSWVASPDGQALHAGSGNSISMSSVTATPDGWLAVGTESGPCTYFCGASNAVRAVIWTSTDGLVWTRQPDSAVLARAQMNGVARGGSGYIAVGSALDDATQLRPVHAVVWTSIDGRTWSRVPDAPLFHPPAGTDQDFGAAMVSVATSRDRIVAVGSVGTQAEVGSALAWWSADGVTWSLSDGDHFLYGQMFGAAVGGSGFLAVGPSGERSCLGGIWSSSTNGESWTCVASDPAFLGFLAYAAASSFDREVVVGFGNPQDSLWASVWLRD